MSTKLTRPQNIILEDARIGFTNFRGEKRKFNKEGDRSFAVFLTDEQAEELLHEGWNVKKSKDRPDGSPGEYYLTVKISYGGTPPRVCIMMGSITRYLDEYTIGEIDTMPIESVDLNIRPYVYEVDGRQGISAYLKDLYITMRHDPLLEKHRSRIYPSHSPMNGDDETF